MALTPQQAAAAFARLAVEVREPASALLRIARTIETRARGKAPVKTGHLRNSVFARVDSATVHVGATAPHATFVHEGTRFMAARPFIREAIDESQADTEGALQDWGEKILGKVGR